MKQKVALKIIMAISLKYLNKALKEKAVPYQILYDKEN